MFRDNGQGLNKVHYNFVFDDGGLGDHICRLIVFNYMEERYKHAVPHLWVPDFFVDFAGHLLPNVFIKPLSKGKTEFNKYFYGKYTSGRTGPGTAGNSHSSMSTHLVDHAFHTLMDKQVEIKHKNYLKINPSRIPYLVPTLSKYVVVCTGYTALVREFLPDYINDVVKYIKSKGYKVVFLGNKNSTVGGGKESLVGEFDGSIDFTQGINLIDKTTLLESAKVIAMSSCVVGMDNGLVHVAGCTNVPIVVGYTTVKPEHRMPYRNDELGWNCFPVVPEKSLECRFCQSNWEFVQWDFRKCFYSDYKCVEMLKPELYIEQLEKIL